MFSPEPPQGFTSEQSQVVIQRQPIPLYNPPQRRRPTGVQTFRVKVTFPPPATAAFQFFRFYQIKKNQVSGILTNMPILIKDSLPAGTILEGAGLDIRAFDSSGNPIPYESIDINLLGGGAADIEIWLNMPVVKDFEFVQLAFGNATATDGSNPNGVYDINYSSVYHLNGVGTDSTVNAETLTLANVTTVPAKIGTGLDFVGNDTSFAIRNPYTPFPSTEITVEFWIQTSTSGEAPLSYAVGGGALANHLTFFDQNNFNIFIINVGQLTGVGVNDGIFHYFVMTWRSSDGQFLVYDNGNLVHSGTLQMGVGFSNNGALVLGQEQDSLGGGFQSPQSLDGILEEVKISNNVRNADYVQTTFNNQNDNDAFWFKTPILTVSQNNFLVDDQGNNIVTEI